MDVVRITELQPKTYVEQGDYIAIDNQSDGTKKVQFTNLLDDTLSTQNKAADASTTGQAISELNTNISELNININTEALARESTDNNLQAQIDQLVAPSGTAPNPAEIENARIGADGVTYDTLGNAIRTQVTNLKSDLISVSEGNVPVEKSVSWANGYVGGSGTIFSSNASKFAVVPLNSGETIAVSTRNNNVSIISSTDAQSVAVGDTVTPIIRATSDTYETFTYSATVAINLVICVRKDEYALRVIKVSEFSEKIAQDYVKEYTKHSFDIEGQRVRPTDGGWSYQNDYYRTDYISCNPNEKIEYYGRSGWYNGECLNALLAFYDANKNFISAITQFGSETTNTTGHLSTTVPSNAYYVKGSSNSIGDGFGITLYDFEADYDEIKNAVAKLPIEKDVETTVLGAEVPSDAVVRYGVSLAYATAIRNAITAWMSDYAGDAMKVPFILHTDQHGRLTSAKKGIFDLLSYLVNWNEVSAIFNLGDTVVNNWTDDNTNTNPLLRNATLEDALKCLSSIPSEKQINVYGNHDTWYNGSVSTPVSGTLPSMQYNNPYFIADGLRTVVLPDNSGFMAVYDDKRKIKYLVLAGWDYADKATEKPNDYTGYQWYWINQKHLNWIISEMSKNEGYDLVLVSHVALCLEDGIAVNPISGSAISLETPEYIVHWDNYLNTLWNARKNKTSGSVSTGLISASFDFTNCTDNCLCAIAGHTHTDAIEYVGNANDGLLGVVFDWFADDTIHFGIIDRRNECIKVWKLSNTNDTPTVENWQKPFNK